MFVFYAFNNFKLNKYISSKPHPQYNLMNLQIEFIFHSCPLCLCMYLSPFHSENERKEK